MRYLPPLIPGADTSHQTGEEMYYSYGWHLSTEHAGDVELQAVEYDWLDEDDDAVVKRLRDADPDLKGWEAVVIVDRARSVRDDMDAVSDLLDEAVAAYYDDDVDAVIEALDEAKRLEEEHGDWPATSSLRERLLEE